MVTKKSKRERPTERLSKIDARLSGIIDRLEDFNPQSAPRRAKGSYYEPKRRRAQDLAVRLRTQSLSQQESNIVRKIEKFEEITVKDYEYLKKHPGRLGELQRIIKKIQSNFEIGRLNFELKKYEDAIIHFRRARGSPIVLHKISSESLYLELTCELETQPDNATTHTRRLLLRRVMELTETVPSNGDYWALQGDIAAKMLGDAKQQYYDEFEHNVLGTQPWRKIITPDMAISAYLKALKVGVSTSMISWSDGANIEEHVHHSLGILYLEEDDLNNASKHFRRLILLQKASEHNETVHDSWLADPYEHLADIAEKQKKWKIAIKYLQKAHKFDPQNAPETLQSIGSNYGLLGEYKKSIEYYDLSLEYLAQWYSDADSSIAYDTDTAELKTKIYFNKHVSLTKLNRFEDALACINLLLLDKPKDHKSLERKAKLEFELGYYECSLATSKLLIEVDGKTSRNLSNHALSLAKLQRSDEALKILKESLTIDPNNLMSLHLKRDILESSEKFDDAEKIVDKSIKLQDSKHQNYHKTRLLFLKASQSNNLRIAKKALHVQDKNIKKFKIKIEEDMLECTVRADILFLLKRNLQCMKLLKIIEKDEVQVDGKPSFATLYKMFRIHLALKRPKEMDKFFTKYEKSVNNHPKLVYVRALHNDELGKYDLALNDLAFVVMSAPELKKQVKRMGFSKKLMSDKRYKLMME